MGRRVVALGPKYEIVALHDRKDVVGRAHIIDHAIHEAKRLSLETGRVLAVVDAELDATRVVARAGKAFWAVACRCRTPGRTGWGTCSICGGTGIAEGPPA